MSRRLRWYLFFMILGAAVGGLAVYLADNPWPVLLGVLSGIIIGSNRSVYGFTDARSSAA